MAMPTIWRPIDAFSRDAASNKGSSWRQGAHQVAQKLHKMGRPPHSDSRRLRPERSGKLEESSSFPPESCRSLDVPTAPPAAAATSATAPRRRLRRPGAIPEKRPNFRNAGAVHYTTRLRALEGDALVAWIENREPKRDTLPRQDQDAHRVRAVPGVAPAFVRGVWDVAVEQKDLDFLDAVGKELQLDLGVGSGDALQHRAGQVGAEVLERAHGVERDLAQLDHPLRVFIGLIERQIRTQFRLDLVISGQRLRLQRAELLCRLALRQGEIVDAVFGHEPCRRGSDASASAGLLICPAGHATGLRDRI